VDNELIGSVLDGRYQVIRKIAEGGMGAIYEAQQTALGRRVAIKTLHAHLAKDDDMVARFRREAMATTTIGHPHIVEVVDLGELKGSGLFLVLEYLEGRDLAKLLKAEGPLPIGRAVRIVAQVADGIAAAHRHGIVHRDLKPENVLLVEGRTQLDFVKIVDFGVSKFVDAAPDACTRTGTALGTPYYMAPEQAQGLKTVDHRADVYAIGVILFRILTGHYPFDDESYPMLVLKICTEPAPLASAWRRDLPEALTALIDRMLAKDPAARPEDCAQLAEALRAFATLDGPPELTGAEAPGTSRPRLLESEAATARQGPGRQPPVEDPEADAAEQRLRPTSAPVMPWVVGVLGLLALAIAGIALFGGGDPEAPEDEVETVELPEPAPPNLRPLGRGGPNEVGWAWRNPVPRGMPTWFAAAVGGPGMVALAGEGGVVARFVDDAALVVWRSGEHRNLFGIAWVAPEQAIAVGEGGALVRLTGSGPSRLDAGTDQTLRAVASLSAMEAIAVGDGGTILRIVGDRVSRLDAGTEHGLSAVHVRRGEVFVVGEEGEVLRFTDVGEGRFVRERAGEATLRAVGGCPRGDLYVAGERGFLARRRGDRWEPLRVSGEPRASFSGIACDRGRAVLTLSDGHAVLASGERTVLLDTGFEQPLYAAAGAEAAVTWLAGAGGHLATLDVDRVSTRVSGPVVSLRDVGDIAGALVAVGEWGRILREGPEGFAQATSPTDAGLAALAALSERTLVAVGDGGALVRIDYRGAELLPFPDTSSQLRDVLAADGELLVVGTGGLVAHGPPEALQLRSMRREEAVDLWGVSGTPRDAVVVGEGGFVARWRDGALGERLPCGLALGLRAVHRTREGIAYAVGERGAIVRIDGENCVREHGDEAGATLNAVGPSPDGSVLAVGDGGQALIRGADGTWRATDLGVTNEHLRGIRGTERSVLVVGTGGTIVEHVRLDGR